MIKVIDTSAIRSEELLNFLSLSKENLGVLTDYAAMEAYKGEAEDAIYKSMEIVGRFPNQIVVLKSTLVICGLKGNLDKIRRRMVDERQTKGFRAFCTHLLAAQNGDASIQRQVNSMRQEANQQMDRIESDAANLPMALDQITKRYTQDELRVIRTGAPITESVAHKFFENTLILAGILFAGHPAVSGLPSWKRLYDTYLFRFALCAQLLALRWAASGNPHKLKAERIRNDIVDISFSASATYYDGIITHDRKLASIYEECKAVLNQGAPSGSLIPLLRPLIPSRNLV